MVQLLLLLHMITLQSACFRREQCSVQSGTPVMLVLETQEATGTWFFVGRRHLTLVQNRPNLA
jgi:hypothetical protein